MSTRRYAKKTAAERQAQAAELQESIAAQVEALRDSEQWKKMLDFMGSFHRYSTGRVGIFEVREWCLSGLTGGGVVGLVQRLFGLVGVQHIVAQPLATLLERAAETGEGRSLAAIVEQALPTRFARLRLLLVSLAI